MVISIGFFYDQIIITLKPKANKAYEFALGIFRELSLIFQYAFMWANSIFNHLPFNSSSLPRKIVRTYNIAHVCVLFKSIKTTWNPLSKELFKTIGRKKGFRITHDIIYKPASGLCLGMSLLFLSIFNRSQKLIPSAKVFDWGAPEKAVKIQALYDALLGIQGKTNPVSIDSLKTDPKRESIFKALEEEGVEITPEIYAQTLELETAWTFLHQPVGRKYDKIHTEIIETLAQYLGFDQAIGKRIENQCEIASQQILQLQIGLYLIQFENHTTAMVKLLSSIAIFDPYCGFAFLDHGYKDLVHFFQFYATQGWISFNAIQLFPKKN